MHEEYADDPNVTEALPDGKTFRLSWDPAVGMARVIARSRDSLDELREAFSVKNKAAFFSQQYGYKGEDRLYNVNKFGYFQAGLAYDVLDWIKTQYGSLACVAISKNMAAFMKEVLRPLAGVAEFKLRNVADDSGRNAELAAAGGRPMAMRPYQEDAVRALLFKAAGRGLIEIPTAGGKSFILGNFIWNAFREIDAGMRFMILVPNVQLVEQFYKDLQDYGFPRRDLAKFEGGMSKREKAENDVSKAKVVIANRQYVFKNAKALPEFDGLICDEVHQCCSDATQRLIAASGARIKVGCSGTLPSDRYLLNTLVGLFGRVAFREEITSLQSAGFISKLRITSLAVTDRDVETNRDLLFNVNSTKKYVADDPDGCDIRFDDAVRAEHDYMAKWYRELYRPALDYAAKLDGNVLVLFDKIDIGLSIFKYFRELYPDRPAFYNDGSTKVSEREQTRLGLEETGGNVLFANVQICGTGVSIKRLHHIVFCFGSKSTTRVIQSIGRTLRLYDGKDYAHLVDVHFNFKYSDRHWRERLKMYKDFYGKARPDESVEAYA